MSFSFHLREMRIHWKILSTGVFFYIRKISLAALLKYATKNGGKTKISLDVQLENYCDDLSQR